MDENETIIERWQKVENYRNGQDEITKNKTDEEMAKYLYNRDKLTQRELERKGVKFVSIDELDDEED